MLIIYYNYSLTGKQQKVTPKFGRQSCANPDNPVKVQNFPAGDDHHAPEQLAQMFSLTRKEVMALMGRLYSPMEKGMLKTSPRCNLPLEFPGNTQSKTYKLSLTK